MSKIKSIARYATTYNKANIYDDSIVENKRPLSYIQMDEQGNIIEDKTFDEDGNLENHILRTFHENNLPKSESFMDIFSEEPYEIRHYTYLDNGLLHSVKVKYPDDEIEEVCIYSPQGKLLQKKTIYLDGYNYIEKEYVWSNDNLLKIIEKDEDDLITTQTMTYNEDGSLAELETIEHLNNDITQTERYTYENGQMVRREILNHKGNIMAVINSKYKGELLAEMVTESDVRFLKHVFLYNENGQKIQESILNRDDLVLTDYITQYNADGLETCTKKYSLNIVDDEKELMLVEETSTEYTYFE